MFVPGRFRQIVVQNIDSGREHVEMVRARTSCSRSKRVDVVEELDQGDMDDETYQ